MKSVVFRSGALIVLFCGMLLFARCDSSFVPDVETLPLEEASDRVEAVQDWYESALAKEQSMPPVLPDGAVNKTLNDSTIAAVLASMVRKYPPDWDQAETWSNGSGGYYAATVLGIDESATSHSDSRISVIRTLVADVDSDGQILSGRLVEFVSPGLDASLFRDYVEQWLAADFGEMQILVAEYTIGYASTQAILYKPGENPQPIKMKLELKASAGKELDGVYCWVTDRYAIEMCEPTPVGAPDSDVCYETETIEITCVITPGHGGGGGGGGGYGGGGGGGGSVDRPGGGGGSGGGKEGRNDGTGDDSEEEESDVKFNLACDKSVERGARAGCRIALTGESEDPVERQTFLWSSSLGAKERTGYAWGGIATESAKVTATASNGWSASANIEVTARQWNSTGIKLDTKEKYTGEPRIQNITRVGFYRLKGSATPARNISEGTGPWDDRFYIKNPPDIQGELRVAEDYDLDAKKQPVYPLKGTLCNLILQDTKITSANYRDVNTKCGSLNAYKGVIGKIIGHEKEHAAGYQQCLNSNLTKQVFKDLEKLTGTHQHVRYQVSDKNGTWGIYWSRLKAAGQWASDVNYPTPFYRFTTTWIYESFSGGGHSANVPC